MSKESGLAFHEEADHVERRSATDTARLVLGVLLLIVVGSVVIDNRGSTRIGYVFGEVRAPLVIVLLAAAFFGAVIGWLLLHRRRHER